MARPEPPVIVGMTTLPSRIGKIRPAIDSLLGNTRVPDKIVLTVPRRPLRGQVELSVPDFLSDGVYQDRVVLNVIEEDFGPGSKLLGCLEHLPEPCVVILADDDMEYREFLVDRLYTAQVANRDTSFSFYAYRSAGMTIGQGADGFSIWSDNLRGIDAFYRDHVQGSSVVFHDDLWISYFLFSRNVAIEELQRRQGDDLVYTTVHSKDALSDLEGELAREHLTREGLRMLRKRSPHPQAVALRLAFRELADKVNAGAQKLTRRFSSR